VLIGRVVRYPVEQHLHALGVAAVDEAVEIGQRTEQRVDAAVVGDVVTEVGHG